MLGVQDYTLKALIDLGGKPLSQNLGVNTPSTLSIKLLKDLGVSIISGEIGLLTPELTPEPLSKAQSDADRAQDSDTIVVEHPGWEKRAQRSDARDRRSGIGASQPPIRSIERSAGSGLSEPSGRSRQPQKIDWQGTLPDQAQDHHSSDQKDQGACDDALQGSRKKARERTNLAPASRSSRRIQKQPPEFQPSGSGAYATQVNTQLTAALGMSYIKAHLY